MALILASHSPRRAELLRQIGLEFTQFAVEIDESVAQYESVTDYVLRMANEKAHAAAEALEHEWSADDLILAADTIVSSQGYIIGKPRSFEDYAQTLSTLSDSKHYVYSAICLLKRQEDGGIKVVDRLNTNSVTFAELPDAFIKAYWESGEPQDKAGGYAVQGIMAQYISRISGSYSGIMGLPLFELREALDELAYTD